MRIIGTVAGAALIVLMLVDAFESILQPRRVTHRFRYSRLYYRSGWALWRGVALVIPPGKRREAFLSIFGPLSLLGLFTTWVIGLIFGFALIQWSLGLPLAVLDDVQGFWAYVYLSGCTFFTIGFGDVRPAATLDRLLGVMEAGLGFAFLAVIISYLPVLYQAFSRREAMISLMDARAGSPPSAAQFLLRLVQAGKLEAVDSFLEQWEQWSAELLESHLSFPVLSYYRSQHDNQSWLATLATILDTCALLIVEVRPHDSYQAQLTFAMARHAAVDLALVLKTPPQSPAAQRLSREQCRRMIETLREAGLEPHGASDAEQRLAELQAMYEPFIAALSRRFLFAVPPVAPEHPVADNWQRSAWMPKTPGIGNLPGGDEHFR